MRAIQELAAQPRSGKGKGPAYQARSQGNVPAIIYGGESDPQMITVDARTLERHTGTGSFLTTPFMLDIEGKKERVLPRALQLDPVSDRPVHVDFMRLAKGATVRIEIPVRFKGQDTSPGLKRGGVLNIVRHDLEVYASAENIPELIEIDISKMDINESLHISAINLPEGVRPRIRERDFTIASIVAPTSVIEEQRAAVAAAKAAESAAAAPAEGEAAAPAAGAAPAKAPEKK